MWHTGARRKGFLLTDQSNLQAHCYDVKSNSWSALPKLPVNASRQNVSLSTHGDKLFAISNNLIEVLNIGKEEALNGNKNQKFKNKSIGIE